MGGIMNVIGSTMTAFLKGLTEVWSWLTSPLYIFGTKLVIKGWEVIPIQIFGAGFVVILGVIIILNIKELII